MMETLDRGSNTCRKCRLVVWNIDVKTVRCRNSNKELDMMDGTVDTTLYTGVQIGIQMRSETSCHCRALRTGKTYFQNYKKETART